MDIVLSGIIGAVIGAVISGILVYIVGPYFSEKFSLRARLAESYLAPFKEWCGDCYGELNEFDKTYLRGDWSDVSSLQIITDYRELHETLRYAPRWVGKIEKDGEYKTIADRLLDLTRLVDRFWHKLEDRYTEELPSVSDVIVFMAHIKGLSNSEREDIAKKIRRHLKEKTQNYNNTNISSILDYLKNEIP